MRLKGVYVGRVLKNYGKLLNVLRSARAHYKYYDISLFRFVKR